MKQRRWITLIFSFLFFHFSAATPAFAAPVIQTINLNAGWNAVFLEVEPSSTISADVFTPISANLTSVWMWNPNSGTVEFIQNPAELVPTEAQYLVYLPTDPILTNLHEIHGNRAYLIQMASAATLNITGEPLPPEVSWKPNSFNFVGFHLDPANLPLFSDFFSSSPAHSGQEAYVLNNATGSWDPVGSSDQMADGEGFWIYCKGSSEFSGSLSVQLAHTNSVEFGQILQEQEITIKNNYGFKQTISINLADVSALPVTVTEYPLFFWEFDTINDIARWTQFPAEPTTLDLTIEPGESQTVKLGVKRAGLTADLPYSANLQMKDISGDLMDEDTGSLFKVPVNVTGISYAGLWVGDVTINKVNQPGFDGDAAAKLLPRPTGSLFSFRLILHVDEAGNTNLMNQAIQMWQEGTWKPDPTDLSKQIIDESGEFVLLSDDALIPFYSGASLRDGQPVGRRISSPVFGNLYADDSVTQITHKTMNGIFSQDSTPLTITLPLPSDDASNPFVHKFHPDHLVPDVNTAAVNTFDINRTITLIFSDTDADNNPIFGSTSLGWDSSALGGVYDEEISGLINETSIHLEGIFTLHRVSNVPTLTLTAP